MTLATLAAAPALGQTPSLQKPTCDAATIAQFEQKLSGMPDGRRKSTAASEVASAKERLGQKQTNDCQDHLLKASVQMK